MTIIVDTNKLAIEIMMHLESAHELINQLGDWDLKHDVQINIESAHDMVQKEFYSAENPIEVPDTIY